MSTGEGGKRLPDLADKRDMIGCIYADEGMKSQKKLRTSFMNGSQVRRARGEGALQLHHVSLRMGQDLVAGRGGESSVDI